ncbi:hypothetical protein D3C80_1439930 [compost metagenome]
MQGRRAATHQGRQSLHEAPQRRRIRHVQEKAHTSKRRRRLARAGRRDRHGLEIGRDHGRRRASHQMIDHQACVVAGLASDVIHRPGGIGGLPVTQALQREGEGAIFERRTAVHHLMDGRGDRDVAELSRLGREGDLPGKTLGGEEGGERLFVVLDRIVDRDDGRHGGPIVGEGLAAGQT